MSEYPPQRRSKPAGALNEQAVEGELLLQQCGACQAVQYPPREVCGQCLSDSLDWKKQAGGGVLLALSDLHSSLEAAFQDALPWQLGSVQLDCGPVVLVHIPDAVKEDKRVQVAHRQQTGGSWILQAEAQATQS
jgi:uncharacterized OB-fold protein